MAINWANPEEDTNILRAVLASGSADRPSLVFSTDEFHGMWWEPDGIHLRGLATPVNAEDAATKAYVDLSSGGITQLTGNVTAGPGSGSQVATIAAGVVTSAMLAGSIAVNKLVAQSSNVVLISDGSGFLTGSSVTTTTLGFLDATSSIQTQLNTKLTNTTGVSDVHADASAALHGAVQLVSGTNVTLSQVGQAITVNATGGGVTPSVVDSAPTIGGAAAEEVAVAGLLTTSIIWAVTQRTVGGAALPIVGWTNTLPGHLNVIYSADMGVGAVVRVVFIP